MRATPFCEAKDLIPSGDWVKTLGWNRDRCKELIDKMRAINETVDVTNALERLLGWLRAV